MFHSLKQLFARRADTPTAAIPSGERVYAIGDIHGRRDLFEVLVEAIEATTGYDEGKGHPQGKKQFIGKAHQVFAPQFISKVEGGKLTVVHTTSIEDGLYEPKADYTKQPL